MNNRGRSWYRNKGKRKRNSDAQDGISGGTAGPNKKSLSDAMETREHCTPFRRSQSSSVFHNWKFYFHDEEYKKGSTTDRKIQVMQEFITSHPDLFPVSNLENNKAYNVDIQILYKNDIFMNEWNSFKDDLLNNPKHTLNCLSIAIDQTMINKINNPNISANLPKAIARISNYGPVIPLRDLKMNSYGKLISVRGCIMRVGRIKHFAQWIEFSCMSCAGHNKVVRQIDGIYTLPTKCIGCNGKKFRPVLSSLHTKTVAFQVIRLQEHFGDEQDDKGRRPRTIDVDLIEDLVCTCMPGNDVTVTGIIKVRGSETHSSKGNINSNPFSLYMEAVYIHNNKFQSQNKCVMGLDLTATDHSAIREVWQDPNVFKLLVHSLCPSIYGHEFIKAGLLLSLFGGSTKNRDVRDDIHILVFGDPGLGKSQLLQACGRVASKGVYVCGSSSTATGLTVTLIKDKSSGEVVLEPGALVMADKGCCCIDEFDKMSTQYQALLEAMEQQSVSLAKSGMVCCLPARTSILAAANPAGGRYKRSKTLIENLNMSQPLLSRFDLIFILLDQPNEHLDNLLSEHVLAIHAGKNSLIEGSQFRGADSSSQSHTQNTLGRKLSLLPTDRIDPIPQRILRNYILYAKQYVKPTITPAAAEVLQNFYLECRARNDREKITPMTPRQLGALIRLTEARAKLELREQATQNDALEIVEIIAYTMADVSVEPVNLDHTLFSGSGKLTANKVKAFVNLLTHQAAATGNKIFTTTEMKDIARRENLIVDDFNALITKLNDNGVILKKGPQLYALTSNN